MRADKIGAETMLSQIVAMVAQAQRSKAPMQRMADSIAGYFAVAVVGAAIVTFFAWGFFGGTQGWVYGLINAVAVLIIACPCALRSEEHTSELQSLMRISYAVFCL